jgi:hypothetical protein
MAVLRKDHYRTSDLAVRLLNPVQAKGAFGAFETPLFPHRIDMRRGASAAKAVPVVRLDRRRVAPAGLFK